MSDLLPPSLAISVATVPSAMPPGVEDASKSVLIGVAMFEVELLAPADFGYRISVRTIPAGMSEAVLVSWLTRNIPAGRRMIGWHLGETIVPALLGAAQAAPSRVAREFVDVIAHAVTGDAVDLADAHGGPMAASFEEICAAAGIPTWPLSGEEALGPSSIGRRARLAGMLAANAVAAWRLWARCVQPDDETSQRFAADALAHWREETRNAPVSHDLRHRLANTMRPLEDREESDEG